jgi:hypothetical protein
MIKSYRFELVAAAVLTALLHTAAFGATINSAVPAAVSGPGLGFASVPVIVTGSANNDNVPSNNADLNSAVAFKRFDSTGLIDIVFTISPSDLTSEYSFSEFVDNNTGVAWSSFRMQLGFGTGANFVLSPSGDGLDFDAPGFDAAPTAATFPTVTTGEDELVFSGGVQGVGAQSYNFRVDVADLAGRTTFTLREIPIAVPEPSTLILASIAVLGLAISRRRN